MEKQNQKVRNTGLTFMSSFLSCHCSLRHLKATQMIIRPLQIIILIMVDVYCMYTHIYIVISKIYFILPTSEIKNILKESRLKLTVHINQKSACKKLST